MYCSQCGCQLSENDNFCRNCGNLVKKPFTRLEIQSKTHIKHDNLGIAQEQLYKHKIWWKNPFSFHWHGQFSLAVSFWVIGILSTVIIIFLNRLLSHSKILGSFYSTKVLVITELLHISFIFALIIWKLRGIWVSASLHNNRGGNKVWAIITKSIVAFWIMILMITFFHTSIPGIKANIAVLTGTNQMAKATLELIDEEQLILYGDIGDGTARELESLLKIRPKVWLIHLESGGGLIYESLLISKIIKERGLDTYSASGCDSACTIVFLAGKSRYLNDGAQLGFHSASLDGKSGSKVQIFNSEMKKYYLDQGLPNYFVKQIIMTDSEDMWYPTYEELLDAKVIDKVLVPNK